MRDELADETFSEPIRSPARADADDSGGLSRRTVLRGVTAGALLVAGIGVGSTPVAATRMCPKTIGYWKNHPEEWIDDNDTETTIDDVPLTHEWLGGEKYTTAELMALLDAPTRGDKSIIMAQQLIAAKLNYWASVKCRESNLALARAEAWLMALHELTGTRLVRDDDGDYEVGLDVSSWEVDIDGTEIEIFDHIYTVYNDTVSVDGVPYSVDNGGLTDATDGAVVKDLLDDYNNGRLCPCSLDDEIEFEDEEDEAERESEPDDEKEEEDDGDHEDDDARATPGPESRPEPDTPPAAANSER